MITNKVSLPWEIQGDTWPDSSFLNGMECELLISWRVTHIITIGDNLVKI